MNHHDTIIIGGGQAGLAAGYWLRQRDLPFLILDANAAVGDSWRKRWDSLRLYSPATYSSLPGYPFPAESLHLPHKNEVAAYFEAYAKRFDLSIRHNTWVRALRRDGDLFHLETSDGDYTASQVIVATGTFRTPKIPHFADDLKPDLPQIHSSDYRRPSQIEGERVLVVGAGSSGAQIALDLAATHKVTLSGRNPGSTPRTLLGRDIYWWYYATGIMTIPRGSFLGRKIASIKGGDWRIDIPKAEILQAGIEWAPRVCEVWGGEPLFEDGRMREVDAIVWATGYKNDYGWIEDIPTDDRGNPCHERGVVDELPGLYFMGLPFQIKVNSSLIGGVGDDAQYITSALAEYAATRQPLRTA